MTTEVPARPGKRGAPAHQPTEQNRRTVETMSAAGIGQAEIARCIGIHHETLRIHYREELDLATARATDAVARSLYAKATSETHPQAAICAMFWLKTRARWRETQVHEHTGADGAPLFRMFAPGETPGKDEA